MRLIGTLGRSLAAFTDARGLVRHFAVVDSKRVNASAVPGGWVYVNRGLIARAETMDELAGVLGHEIGHVTRRHSVQQMQQSQQVGGGLEEGVQTSVKAGIDPHGVPKMFRILLNERQSNPGAVDAFFATHPLEESRIAATPNRSRRIRRRSCGI